MRVVHTLPILANAEIDLTITPTQAGSTRRAGTTVSGSFYAVGDSVSFQAQVVESASGEVLASVGPVLASVRDPRAGVEELRQRTTGAPPRPTDVCEHPQTPLASAVAPWHELQHVVRRRVLRYFRGHPPKVGRGLLDEVDAHGMLSWQGSGGFSIDASVHIDGEDRAAVEIPILTM